MATTGICEHCGVGVQFVSHEPDSRFMLPQAITNKIAESSSTAQLDALGFSLTTMHCPLCSKPIIYLAEKKPNPSRPGYHFDSSLIYPKRRLREAPPEVENKEIRRDYKEAVGVAEESLRGAAALARRALQGALREKGFTHLSKKLMREIEAAEKDPKMPSTLGEKLHFLREVGNDGAHPNYDLAGEVVDVTPEEFKMLIETLGEFFDVFYVRPVRHAATMEANKARKKKDP
jgi:hypothetical protein